MTSASSEAIARLDGFLAEHTDAIRALTHEALAFVDARLAGATRLVYSNWNATVIAYSPDGRSTHALCSVAAYRRWVNLFIRSEGDLDDPHGLLQGKGATMRHVRIAAASDLDARVSDMLDDAEARWSWSFDHDLPMTTVVASVADKRQPRR